MTGSGGRRRRAAAGIASLALCGMLAGCGAGAEVAVTPGPSPAASVALSTTLLAARAQVFAVLAASQLQVTDARTPYRPGESPALAASPRTVIQVTLPAAPDPGYVVIYDLTDPGLAAGAAQELADYLASGPGRIQFPGDARFTIRQVGSAVVFHHWSPSGSADPESERAIETALATIGQGFDVRG
jgi:hypothetical protein